VLDVDSDADIDIIEKINQLGKPESAFVSDA
jgi:hypothetical protein